MSANPNASADTLSASQQQLLTSVQQLKDAHTELMRRYSAATDDADRTNIMNELEKNATLRASLLSSAGETALVQNQAIVTKKNDAASSHAMASLIRAEKQFAQDQAEEIQDIRNNKQRMIQLNTYYGKRFMAQAGVMKIFIYMCIPILILAVLANMGFLPNYIAGFAIIASIVVGIIFIYSAVSDINRRDKMNFDEYTWEFDPSRVGPIVHHHRHRGKKDNSDGGMGAGMGCFDKSCCASPTTWDATSKQCIFVNDAQGEGSAVKGSAHHKAGKHGSAATNYSLLGDLSSSGTAPTAAATATPTATATATATTTATSQPTSNLCWTDTNRALKGQCMGGWTYDAAADTCTAPAGSAASSLKVCSPYKVSDMNATTPSGWESYMKLCVGPYLKEGDLSNCT